MIAINIFTMPTVKFTKALKRFFPQLTDTTAKGRTLSEILCEMDTCYPGVRSYVLDEHGRLRKHVNIFIDGTIITDRNALSDSFSDNSEIYIIQALSGG
jgi:molybdopterin synthase sulfur carrier subunit